MVKRIRYGIVPAGQTELALPATPRLLRDVNVQDAAGLLRLLQEERAMTTEGSMAWVKVPTSLGPRWEKLKHSSALPAVEDLEVVIELGIAATAAAAAAGPGSAAKAAATAPAIDHTGKWVLAGLVGVAVAIMATMWGPVRDFTSDVKEAKDVTFKYFEEKDPALKAIIAGVRGVNQAGTRSRART